MKQKWWFTLKSQSGATFVIYVTFSRGLSLLTSLSKCFQEVCSTMNSRWKRCIVNVAWECQQYGWLDLCAQTISEITAAAHTGFKGIWVFEPCCWVRGEVLNHQSTQLKQHIYQLSENQMLSSRFSRCLSCVDLPPATNSNLNFQRWKVFSNSQTHQQRQTGTEPWFFFLAVDKTNHLKISEYHCFCDNSQLTSYKCQISENNIPNHDHLDKD